MGVGPGSAGGVDDPLLFLRGDKRKSQPFESAAPTSRPRSRCFRRLLLFGRNARGRASVVTPPQFHRRLLNMVRAPSAWFDRLETPGADCRVVRPPRPLMRSTLALATLSGLVACEPKLRAGDVVCPTDASASPAATWTDPIAVPWSTSFEDQFCDYKQAAGYCYADDDASFQIVSAPRPHSGRYAAAFRVNAADPKALQARCVRQGGLPTAAYYEAWYFVPVSAAANGNWNLWYFEGGSDENSQVPLWNISLVSGPNGAPALTAYSPLDGGQRYPMRRTVAIPIARWFRIKFLLERASDATGRAALYQDETLLFDESQIVTDGPSSAVFGQWYVGNLASIRGLAPADSTIYVDDVSVSAPR